MYSKIVDSKTGLKVSVTSRLGKNILEKYLNVLTGGTSATKKAAPSEENVTLLTEEDDVHVVTKEVAFMSGFVRSFFYDDDDEDLEEDLAAGSRTPEPSRTIPLTTATATLAKVIEFCEHHCDVKAAAAERVAMAQVEGDDEDDNEAPTIGAVNRVKDTEDELLPAEFEASIASAAAPLKSASLLECGIPQWYVTFVEIAEGTPSEKELFYDLILAADYLKIPPLFNLTCAKMASMMKGKTVHEIRETFEIGECTEESMAEPIANASWLVGLKKGAVKAAKLKLKVERAAELVKMRKKFEEAWGEVAQ